MWVPPEALNFSVRKEEVGGLERSVTGLKYLSFLTPLLSTTKKSKKSKGKKYHA